MPALQTLAVALSALLVVGATRQSVSPSKQTVVDETLSKNSTCSVKDQTILFRDARTSVGDVPRAFDVMVTPAGTEFGTAAALTAGTMMLDPKAHDWFNLDVGWVVVRLKPDANRQSKAASIEDWPVVRVRMLDAGAEGTTFGVVASTDKGGQEYVDLMMLDGSAVWAAQHGSGKRAAVITADQAGVVFIRATFKDNDPATLPTIELLRYTDYARAALNRIRLAERTKVWSARGPVE